MATSVTFEQETLISQTRLSFRTIQRITIERETYLSRGFSNSQIILWRDYLIGSYVRVQSSAHGIFLWSMTENSVFYFEVCHSFFPSLGALNLNSRQMGFTPLCNKVINDLLFVSFDMLYGPHWTATYRCIHIPSLVISTQLPGGRLSLTENAFAILLPKCIMESRATGSILYVKTNIYYIPACPPAHPRYCVIIERVLRQPQRVEWEVLEAEIDLSIPGPIKVFSRVSKQYTTVQHSAYPLHGRDDDLLLCLPLGRGGLPRASLSIRFLRVGKPSKERLARLGGVDKLCLSRLTVDRDAGYVIISAGHGCTRNYYFIWWLDKRKPGNMVYLRTRELITSWSRGLLRRF